MENRGAGDRKETELEEERQLNLYLAAAIFSISVALVGSNDLWGRGETVNFNIHFYHLLTSNICYKLWDVLLIPTV